jgi:hypothetical protein
MPRIQPTEKQQMALPKLITVTIKQEAQKELKCPGHHCYQLAGQEKQGHSNQALSVRLLQPGPAAQSSVTALEEHMWGTTASVICPFCVFCHLLASCARAGDISPLKSFSQDVQKDKKQWKKFNMANPTQQGVG